MERLKRIIITIVITIATVVFLLGFIDKSNSGKETEKADIVYSIDDIPDDMRNIASLSTRQQDMICAVSKGLIEIDSQGKMMPALAKSVDVTDNGIQYNFAIRDDVFWSDGKSITADDLAENGDFYVGTTDYNTNGDIYRFKKDGTFIEKFESGGVSPRAAVFID